MTRILLRIFTVLTVAVVTGCNGQLPMALGLAEGAAGALSGVALPLVSEEKVVKIEKISREGAESAQRIANILTIVNASAVADLERRAAAAGPE